MGGISIHLRRVHRHLGNNKRKEEEAVARADAEGSGARTPDMQPVGEASLMSNPLVLGLHLDF